MTEAIVELRRVKEHMCDLLAWFSIGRWWTSYNFWQRMETLASRVINQFTLGFTWKRKRKITWPVTFPSINMSIVSFSTAISNNPHNVLWLRAIPFQPSQMVHHFAWRHVSECGGFFDVVSYGWSGHMTIFKWSWHQALIRSDATWTQWMTQSSLIFLSMTEGWRQARSSVSDENEEPKNVVAMCLCQWFAKANKTTFTSLA